MSTLPNADEFSAFGLALYGHGWQTALARALDVNTRTVRRWASGETPVPEAVWDELHKVAGTDERGLPTWPRDEWMVAESPSGRGYVIHARHPRFIARIVETDPDSGAAIPDEGEVDQSTGIVYQAAEDLDLCEIVWLDPPPSGSVLTQLLERAADIATVAE